jgi:hypothetical protein
VNGAVLTFFAGCAGLVIGLLAWIGWAAGASLTVLRQIRAQVDALEEARKRRRADL